MLKSHSGEFCGAVNSWELKKIEDNIQGECIIPTQ